MPHVIRWWRWVAVPVLLLVVVSIGLVIEAVVNDPLYGATVTLQRRMATDGFRTPSSPYLYDAKLAAISVDRLKEPEILIPVIEQLDLVKVFSSPAKVRTLPEVYERIRRSMVVKEDPERGIVWVTFFDTDPQRATEIANRIGKMYVAKHLEDLRAKMKVDLEGTTEWDEMLQKSMEAAAAEMGRLRASAGIVDREPEREEGMLSGSEDEWALKAYRASKRRYLNAARSLEPNRRESAAWIRYEANAVRIFWVAEAPREPNWSWLFDAADVVMQRLRERWGK